MMPTEKELLIAYPASTTGGILKVKVSLPEPVITVPVPKVTQDPPTFKQADFTYTVEAVPTTGPIPLPPPPGARNNLILNMDFNKGQLPAAGILNMQPLSRFSIKNIAGKNYAEVTVAKGDLPISGTNRSEFNIPTNKAEQFKEGQERWYGERYRLPTSYANDISPEVVYQQHEFSGSASPHFALWTKSGHWFTAINGQQDLDMGAYEFDKETDFVFHHIWSIADHGLIEVFKDGKLMKSYPGPNMPSDTRLPYLKTGLYKWDWIKNPGRSTTSSRTLYIGSIFIGNEKAGFNDVKP